MDINLRRVGKYIDCRITDSGTTIALGLHDADEAEKLSRELLAASRELQEHADEYREARAASDTEPGCSHTAKLCNSPEAARAQGEKGTDSK